jgi:hypothetical protein
MYEKVEYIHECVSTIEKIHKSVLMFEKVRKSIQLKYFFHVQYMQYKIIIPLLKRGRGTVCEKAGTHTSLINEKNMS